MVEIARQFKKIADDVKEKLDAAKAVTFVGIGAGLLGICAAPFTGGASLALASVAAGGTVAVAGFVSQIIIETGHAKDLKNLGENFIDIAEPLNEYLEIIKANCEKLERYEEPQIVRMKDDIRQVTVTCGQANDEFKSMRGFMENLIMLIVKIIIKKLTLSSEEDKMLKDRIVRSADQCWTIIRKFDDIKETLQTLRR